MRTICFVVLTVAGAIAGNSNAIILTATADADGVSCCGFGTETRTIASYSISYSQAGSRTGDDVAWEFYTRLGCGNGAKKPLWFFTEALRAEGNQSDGVFLDGEICPFGLKAFTTIVVEPSDTEPGVGLTRISVCAQPCEGLTCEGDGGPGFPPPPF